MKNLVNVNTCFKSLEKPHCIDLFLTNNYRSFLSTCALSSGLSDFHKLVVTVMKTTFPKANPKKIFYRKYKNFDVSNFSNHLIHHISAHAETRTSFKKFQEIILHELNIHAPWKQNFIRANEVPYMNKKLRKAIMTRSRLANEYHNTKSLTETFKKHKNYCNRLYKRERNIFFKNIDTNSITDNKKFWRTMSPFLTDKGTRNSSIKLIEETKIIIDDAEVAETLNTYFFHAESSLGISEPTDFISDDVVLNDPIDLIVHKFSNHPSIRIIKAMYESSSFAFALV